MHDDGGPDQVGGEGVPAFRHTVPGLLDHAVREHGDTEFLVGLDFRLTFAEVQSRSAVVARRLLDRGVGKGTRLGLMFPNSADAVLLFLAAARVGAFVMPFSTLARPGELRTMLRRSDVAHLVVPPVLFGQDHLAFLEEALPGLRGATPPLALADAPYLRHVWTTAPSDRPWAVELADRDRPRAGADLLAAVEEQVTPADWLVTIWTSGTTGDPKGVIHSHGVQVRQAARLSQLFAQSKGERILAGLPFFWVGGLTLNLLGAMYGGATLLCPEKVDPDTVLPLVEHERPTRAAIWSRRAVERIVSDPRFSTYDPDVTAPFIRLLESPVGNPRFHNSLGMSETAGPHTAVPVEEVAEPLPEALWGSFGRPVEGVEHRIADPVTGDTMPPGEEGEICVRGDTLMQGLYKVERQDAFDPAGWFRTGDLGYFAEGYLFFRGRRDDMIKTSGANVSPLEVEVQLTALEGVKAAFVFGVPDPERGQAVVAAVVPVAPGSADADELTAALVHRLAAYKVPRAIVVLGEDDVPYLVSGKPDVRAVRRHVGAALADGSGGAEVAPGEGATAR